MLLHLSPFQCLDLLTYVSTASFPVSSYHALPFHILDLLEFHGILSAGLAQVWEFTVPHAVDSQPQFRFSSTFTTRDPQGSPFCSPFVVGLAFLCFLFFFFNCNSNYFKHNYILQHFESTTLKQPVLSSEANSVSRLLKRPWKHHWNGDLWLKEYQNFFLKDSDKSK